MLIFFIHLKPAIALVMSPSNLWKTPRGNIQRLLSNQTSIAVTHVRHNVYPAITKHLHNICTTSTERLRRSANIVQMLYKCFVFSGIIWLQSVDRMKCWHHSVTARKGVNCSLHSVTTRRALFELRDWAPVTGPRANKTDWWRTVVRY